MKAVKKVRTRPGFTLVELLTVVAILALLSALVAGGVAKVRNAQMQRNAEQTLIKLQITLDQQWKALADKVGLERGRGKIDPKLTTFCTLTPTDNKELDRAAALYLYMLTRNELPQNFTEAVTAVTINGYSLPARKAFGNVSQVDKTKPVMAGAASGGRQVAATVTPEVEAAVLLYLILAEKSLEGTTFQADDATQSAQTELFFTTTSGGSLSFRAFADPWGTPITFTRYTVGGLGFAGTATTGELNNPPYIASGNNRDPLDPKNLLSGWNNATNKTTALGQLGSRYDGTSAGPPAGFATLAAAGFDGMNKQPSVYAAGPDRKFVDPNLPSTQQNLFGGDNIAGFRLRREGARGD